MRRMTGRGTDFPHRTSAGTELPMNMRSASLRAKPNIRESPWSFAICTHATPPQMTSDEGQRTSLLHQIRRLARVRGWRSEQINICTFLQHRPADLGNGMGGIRARDFPGAARGFSQKFGITQQLESKLRNFLERPRAKRHAILFQVPNMIIFRTGN